MCFHSIFFWIKTEIFYICWVIFRRFHPLGSIHWVPSVVSVAGKWTWKVTGSNFELIWMVLKVLQRSVSSRFFWKNFFFTKFFYKRNTIFPHFWHFCCRTSPCPPWAIRFTMASTIPLSLSVSKTVQVLEPSSHSAKVVSFISLDNRWCYIIVIITITIIIVILFKWTWYILSLWNIFCYGPFMIMNCFIYGICHYLSLFFLTVFMFYIV